MAKCPVCGQRKGKRVCVQHGEPVCSVCCGETRTRECQGCSYHTGSSKGYNYTQVPFFSMEMMGDRDRESMAEWVEWAICHLDRKEAMTDSQARSLLERVLDVLHFREKAPSFSDALEKRRFTWFTGELMKIVKLYPDDQWTRVVATVWRSVKRHENGSRGYLDFVAEYVPDSAPIKKPSMLAKIFRA